MVRIEICLEDSFVNIMMREILWMLIIYQSDKENVLILKYYSFENYFLNPEIMSKLGVIESEDAFYEILYDKWREYLHRIKSGVHLIQMMGRDFTSPQDMKEHMEEIKTYMRGHNLFDIFYGRYKKKRKIY